MVQNNKYLDHEGVGYLWGKMKEYIDNECANNSNILIPKYVSDKSEITSEGLYQVVLNTTLTTIKDGKVYLDTSEVTNMSSMFSNCSGLTSLDLSNFNTSKVTNMSSMFNGCSKLTSLNLSNFDISKVTSMNSMFGLCSELEYIDLSNWDPSNLPSSGLFGFGTMEEPTPKVHTLKFPKMGMTKSGEYEFHQAKPLGTAGEESLRSLKELFSYDRVANGLATLPYTNENGELVQGTNILRVSLPEQAKSLFSDSEKAEITAKGYTLVWGGW